MTDEVKKEPEKKEPEVKPEVKKEPEPTAKQQEQMKTKEVPEKEQVLKKIQDILKEYGGREPDIPLNHAYWGLVNRYRSL